MEAFIKFVLSNFTLTFLVLGIFASVVSLVRQHQVEVVLNKQVVVEALFSYFLLFTVGLNFLYNFVMHVFFADMTAHFIGWANSPFQYEVGFASLGFAVAGLMAFKQQGFGFRAATIIPPAVFTWAAAGGHIYQMVEVHNFAPGNAGVIFWTDILLPILSFALLYQQYAVENKSRSQS